MASKGLLEQVVRGLVGDKIRPTYSPTFSTQELFDSIKLAIFRHNRSYTLDTLPDTELTMVAYRTAIDLCHELAARNAPFVLSNIEGMTVDRTGAMNNWLQLADRYREFYQIEITGGLGADGLIQVGELTRISGTTGREVPFYNVKPFEPVVLSLTVDGSGKVTLNWTNIRDQDFFAYVIKRRDLPTGTWTEVTSIYDPLTVTYQDTVSVGRYDYMVEGWRGVAGERTAPYPVNYNAFQYLTTPSNVVTADVV